MSAQDERVLEELALLRAMQFPSMPAADRAHMLEEVTRLGEEYEAARAIEQDEKSTEKQKKYAKAVGDSIAKGLPDIVKGVAGAISAFQSGDNLSGSAAIMDICAAAAPIIAAVLDLAGPEGALVGAIFSVVGQILRFFGPKQPSLKDQIAELLKEQDAREQLVDLGAIGLSLEEYDASVTDAAAMIALPPLPLHEMPLLTPTEGTQFEKRLADINLKLDHAVIQFTPAQFENWRVAAWLKMAEKQDNKLWPDVLALWCRTYSDMISIRMRFIGLADPTKVDKLLAYTLPDGACPLPPDTKSNIYERLIDLNARIDAFRDEAAACNATALKVLAEVTPAAQGWGMHAAVGPDHGIYFVSGPSNTKEGRWVGRSDRNYYHRLALLAPRSGSPKGYELKPRHHLFLLKSDGTGFPGDPGVAPGSVHDWMDYGRVRAFTYDIEDARFIQDSPHYHDICVAQLTPGQLDCWAGQPDGIRRGTLEGPDFKGVFKPGEMVATTKAPVDHVQAVHPVSDSVLPDDPDRDAVTWSAVGPEDLVVYGGLRDSGEICVVALGGQHALPSPWPGYGGIAADRTFLWVFHRFGFACATHASILAALQNPGRAVRWMRYDLPGRLQGRFTTDLNGHAISADDPKAAMYPDQGQHENRWLMPGAIETVHPMPALKGLVSLGASDDGTLSACVVYREARRHYDETRFLIWQATEATRMYSTSYTVDVAAGSLRVDDAWNLFSAEALGFRVRKLPVPCWSLFSSLKARLA